MSLISLLITVAVVGLFLWLVNAYIPMESTVKRILNGIVIFVLVIWLLQSFGIIGSLGGLRIR